MLDGKRFCLVSSGHVASNPRLVKEADALAEAGARVDVVAAQTLDRLKSHDADLVSRRAWRFHPVDVTRAAAPASYLANASLRAAALRVPRALWSVPGVAERAWSRITAVLARAAGALPADLYIGHNLAALPAVARAARKHGSRFAFDIEDWHSEELPDLPGNERWRALARLIEDRYLPGCAYVTASSPMISAAYGERLARDVPSILNVFPLSHARNVVAGQRTQPSLYWFSQTLGPGRGLEPILESMSLMRHPVHLHLRGEWSPGYEDELQGLASRLAVGRRVHFHASAAPDAMVELASQHAFGLSVELGRTVHNRACLANKIFTYLLGGSVVVLSDTPAQGQLAAELGEAAVVVPLDRPAEVASILDRCVSDEAALVRRKAAARRLALSRFNWDVEKERWLPIVARAVA